MTEHPQAGGESELKRERETLARADQDIVEGTERLRRQRAMVLRLRIEGREDAQAQRLEQGLAETLTEWIRHRDMIRLRIAYLEQGQSPAEGVE
ncbi:MAG: hypothetical protein ACTHLT_18805 [Devosia sp.]